MPDELPGREQASLAARVRRGRTTCEGCGATTESLVKYYGRTLRMTRAPAASSRTSPVEGSAPRAAEMMSTTTAPKAQTSRCQFGFVAMKRRPKSQKMKGHVPITAGVGSAAFGALGGAWLSGVERSSVAARLPVVSAVTGRVPRAERRLTDPDGEGSSTSWELGDRCRRTNAPACSS